MNPLVREAVLIQKDLGGVTFVGAVGVMMHTKFSRESQDIDLVVANYVSAEYLEARGYLERIENGKEIRRTPRGYKIDIYTRDLNGMSVDAIMSSSVEIPVGRGQTLRVASLEALIVAKHRASRLQDIADLDAIARKKFQKIQWEQIRLLTSNVEYEDIQNAMRLRAG